MVFGVGPEGHIAARNVTGRRSRRGPNEGAFATGTKLENGGGAFAIGLKGNFVATRVVGIFAVSQVEGIWSSVKFFDMPCRPKPFTHTGVEGLRQRGLPKI